jgi:hypothetical protein
MPFIIRHKATHPDALTKRFPDSPIIDVTSKGPDPWVRFSPFYPHDGIPVPFSPGVTTASVEGAWQGLKVFESADVDPARFENRTMRRLKRTVRRFGPCKGHRRGVDGAELLGYLEARWQIYLPLYRYLLERCVTAEIEALRELGADRKVVLLDYGTNGDPNDLRKPLSHGALLARWLNGRWPERGPAQPA